MKLTINTRLTIEDDNARKKVIELLDKNNDLYAIECEDIIIFKKEESASTEIDSNNIIEKLILLYDRLYRGQSTLRDSIKDGKFGNNHNDIINRIINDFLPMINVCYIPKDFVEENYVLKADVLNVDSETVSKEAAIDDHISSIMKRLLDLYSKLNKNNDLENIVDYTADINQKFAFIKDVIGLIYMTIDKKYMSKEEVEEKYCDEYYYDYINCQIKFIQGMLLKLGVKVDIKRVEYNLPKSLVENIMSSLLHQLDESIVDTISIHNETLVNKDEEIHNLEKALAYYKDVETIPDEDDTEDDTAYYSDMFHTLRGLGLL